MAVPIPLLTAGDILQVRTYCYTIDQIGINVLGYKITAVTVPAATLQDAADRIDVLVFAAYKGLIANTSSYLGVDVRTVSPTVSLTWNTSAHSGVGTAGAIALPTQSCGMFTKQTGVPGPAGRGRVYVPFPANDDNAAGAKPTAGYMTRLGGLAGILTAVVTVTVGASIATLVPVILDRADLPNSLTVVGATAREKWATQRRRGVYGAKNTLPF